MSSLSYSLALAMGKNTAIYPFLYKYLPFFDKIRYPVKFLFLLALFLSITSGLGYDSLRKGLCENNRWVKRIIIGLFGVTVAASFIFGGLYYFDHEIRTALELRGLVPPDYNELSINLHNVKRLLFFIIIFGLSLLLFLRHPKTRRVQPYVMIFILTIDLFFAHRGFYHKTRGDIYHMEGESVRFLSQNDEIFRFFTTPKTKKEGAVLYVGDSSQGLSTLVDRGYLERLAIEKEKVTGYNLESRLFDVEGVDVMGIKEYANLLSLLNTATGPDVTNLMALLNVKYLISIPQVDSEEFKLVKTILTETSIPVEDLEDKNIIKIYENLNYLPRAFLVEDYRIITEEDDYYKILQEKEFVPGKEVLLYEEPWGENKRLEARGKRQGSNNNQKRGQSLFYDSAIAPSVNRDSPQRESDKVAITDYKSNSVQLKVNLDRPKILVLSDVYYPGWKVFVDGNERKIFKANYAFRALPLEPGSHDVDFIYDPISFKIGMYISLATVLVLIGLGMLRLSTSVIPQLRQEY
ncbi:MAG: YfhO family protein [Thermodesulfobacteriota bacterium]